MAASALPVSVKWATADGTAVAGSDYLATNGVLTAVQQVNVRVPLVVRLEGTNVDLGKQLLKDSGLPIITADGLADAAQKIVAASKK